MTAPEANGSWKTSAETGRTRARQWSRTAWAMGLLFASLPVASRLFLGSWGFDGAAPLAILCFAVGAYLHLVGRRRFPAMPDPAATLDQAFQFASSGRIDRAIASLTKTIRRNPRFWQAFQYRGELYLSQQGSIEAALRDFDEAIRLAPEEHPLYTLRGYAHNLLGDQGSALADYERAAALAARCGAAATPVIPRPE